MDTRDVDKILTEQASALLESVKLREPGSQDRLGAWLRESPRHIRHYLTMVAIDRELEDIDPERKFILGPPRSDGNVVPLGHEPPLGQTAASKRSVLTLLAAAFCAIAVLLFVGSKLRTSAGFRDEVFATAVGEQRAVELEDGSIVQLNTQSRLEVSFEKNVRNVRLIAGEALFKVHHDASRPFRVHTVDATIQAVGTEFNVYRRPEGTTVSVLEGKVRVESEREASESSTLKPVDGSGASALEKRGGQIRTTNLGAGQEARISRAGGITAQRALDLATMAAWRQRRLVFKSTPLADMVTEFNRYNRTPHFVLRGGDVSGRPFTGIFDADDPESLIQLLEREPGLDLKRNGDEIVIKATPDGEAVLAETPGH